MSEVSDLLGPLGVGTAAVSIAVAVFLVMLAVLAVLAFVFQSRAPFVLELARIFFRRAMPGEEPEPPPTGEESEPPPTVDGSPCRCRPVLSGGPKGGAGQRLRAFMRARRPS